MKSYDGYLIDLDGTLFQGKEMIPGALSFVEQLIRKKIPYLYLTNNSSRTPVQVAAVLRKFGFPAHPAQVYTSALATAEYIQEKWGNPSVYVIGEEGIQQALHEIGCRFTEESPEVVVVGIDRQFTYEKMKKACLAIRAGASFIGTNADRALPTEEGLLPGGGSLVLGIAAATGVDPLFIGKPEPIIMQYAQQTLGVAAADTLVVGDNLETDILAGLRGGMDTLLVYTGCTTREIAKQATIRATYEVDDLSGWTV
jgi:4-nitrophenyl phosphatase